LQTLLNLLNMMYYWEKIKSLFENQECNVEHVAKLITRCLKLYMLIDGLMTVFNLIQKTEVSLIFLFIIFLKAVSYNSLSLIKRLIVAIKLLLQENSTLPFGF